MVIIAPFCLWIVNLKFIEVVEVLESIQNDLRILVREHWLMRIQNQLL